MRCTVALKRVPVGKVVACVDVPGVSVLLADGDAVEAVGSGGDVAGAEGVAPARVAPAVAPVLG